MNAIVPYARLVDLADAAAPEPTDVQIVDALVEAFDLSPRAVIERLICVDFVGVRKQVTP